MKTDDELSDELGWTASPVAPVARAPFVMPTAFEVDQWWRVHVQKLPPYDPQEPPATIQPRLLTVRMKDAGVKP